MRRRVRDLPTTIYLMLVLAFFCGMPPPSAGFYRFSQIGYRFKLDSDRGASMRRITFVVETKLIRAGLGGLSAVVGLLQKIVSAARILCAFTYNQFALERIELL